MNSIVEDAIKIQFIDLGYLPNYPYHLISEKEMIDAFIREEEVPDPEDPDKTIKQLAGFFVDFYPFPEEFSEIYEDPQTGNTVDLKEVYNHLIYGEINEYGKEIDGILTALTKHVENPKENPIIPNWIYSYMFMRPITFESDEMDISYLYDLLGVEKIGVPEFTEDIAYLCYCNSLDWMKRQTSVYRLHPRPATIFGETHVTKSLRLEEANILLDER